MAYQLKTLNIAPGGINVLPPGDQVSEGSSLDLTDFWPASAGRLEEAPSIVLRNSASAVSDQDSIVEADGRIYYGGGGNLRQIGRGGSTEIIDSSYDGTPLGLISCQGYCWIMNRGRQKKDDGTTVSDWTPAAPSAQPALTDEGPPGGQDMLEYTYYVTWVLGTLGETNPSPNNWITPAAAGSMIEITQPAGPPPTATGWNVYRQVPPYGGAHLDAGTPYLVNPTPIPIATTTYDDFGDADHWQTDTALLQLGVLMEADHDPAPAARVLANQVYNGRIVAASSAAHPNRIWFTPALQPGFFRGSGNPSDGDWVDVGTDKGDAVLAISVRPGMLIIYRQKSIWRHVGDLGATDADLHAVVPDMGIVGVRAMVSTSLGDYYVSQDGVYKFNNDWGQKLSEPVEPIFLGKVTENFQQLGVSYRSQCAIGFRNGRLWVSYPNASGINANSLVWHVDSQRWFAASGGWLAFLDRGVEFLGAHAGIFALENQFNPSSALLSYQSQYLDAGLPDHQKTFADLVLNHNTQGSTFTIVCRTNKDATSNDSFTLVTFSSSALTKTVFPLVYPSGYAVVALRGKPIRAFNLSIRITGSSAETGTPIIIDSPLLVHYYLEARQGRTFNTGITNHGLEGVGVMDQIEIDCDTSAGTATDTITTDIPGGVMGGVTAFGGGMAQSTGRQIMRLVPTPPLDGRLFQHQIASSNQFQIYGYKVRILPIGLYIDGSQSEFWQPDPISIGV